MDIQKIPHESQVYDVMEGASRWEVKVHEHGLVALVDVMPRLVPVEKTADFAIVQAARVSYGEGTKQVNEDRGLIRYLARHRHCYHPSMQVLTLEGWKNWSDCRYSETFLVPCPSTRLLRPETLTVECFDADEQMERYKNGRMSYLVTPDHRMYFRGKYQERFEVMRASEMPRWGHFDSQSGYRYIPPDTKPSAKGRLAGFILGDGSWSGRGVSFHIRKERKKDYLRQLLKELGMGATECESSTCTDATVFYLAAGHVHDTGLLDLIEIGQRSANKRLRAIPALAEDVAGVFHGLVNSDGHVNEGRNDRVEFSSISKVLADQFETLAAMMGYDAHHRGMRLGVFMVHAHPPGRTTLEARKHHFSSIHYKGPVYCATTSTGLLMVRGSQFEFGFVCGNTTPCEMVEFKFHHVMPIFVARQWIRHRTACLSGDTLLHFDLPGGMKKRGSRLITMSVKDVYARFQPTRNVSRPSRQANAFHNRSRVQSMNLRCLDESTDHVTHTQIVDIWETGVKKVWGVCYKGRSVKASADHLFLTGRGWRRLGEVADLNTHGLCAMKGGERLSWIGPGSGTGVPAFFNRIDPETESWVDVFGWEGYYEVSDQGRVRRWAGGRGAVAICCKSLTVSDGRAVVSLNRPGRQETRLVHQLVMEAFCGECPTSMEVCYNDGNALNNNLDNLRYGTKQSNADDRIRDGATTRLCRQFVTPEIRYAGEEPTYDIEVAGPWHNFSAAGFVVHNSVNEYSARYSVVKDRFYRPSVEGVRQQSKTNRQGGEAPADVSTAEEFLRYLEETERAQYAGYEKALAGGIARELARMGLPLSIYTEWYWKIDLHNLLHFLSLRMDPHAQQEIRDYANAMFALIQPIVPVAAEAFLDYRLHSMALSRLEIEALRTGQPLATDNKREQAEWEEKKKKLGLAQEGSREEGCTGV